MRDWPPATPPAMGIDYFGDLSGEYAVIELDPAMWQKLLSEVAGIGPGTSFTDKVVNAQTYYAVPDVQATCAVLSAFVSEDKVQAGKKKLTDTQAATLTSDAQDIATAIGCN